QRRITEADLAQRIFERPIGLVCVRRAQEYAEQYEQDRSPNRVSSHSTERLTARYAVSDRVGQGNTHKKRKPRLNQVVERTAGPSHVALMVAEKSPNL